jgi:hypothetical protein
MTSLKTTKIDRERIMNDLLNTSIISALIGGFGLTLLIAPTDGLYISTIIYILA